MFRKLNPNIEKALKQPETEIDWKSEGFEEYATHSAMDEVEELWAENKILKGKDIKKGDGQEGYDLPVEKSGVEIEKEIQAKEPKLTKDELEEFLNVRIRSGVRWVLHDHIKGNKRDMESEKIVASSEEGEPVAVDASKMPMGAPNGPDFDRLAKQEYEHLVRQYAYDKNILEACRLLKVDQAYVKKQIMEEWKSVQSEYKKSQELSKNVDAFTKAAPKGVDEAKYKRCKERVKRNSPDVNEYAVCAASLQGKAKKSNLDETYDLIKAEKSKKSCPCKDASKGCDKCGRGVVSGNPDEIIVHGKKSFDEIYEIIKGGQGSGRKKEGPMASLASEIVGSAERKELAEKMVKEAEKKKKK